MRALGFERLESRLLLAANISLKKNGTLLIRGGAADDILSLIGTGEEGEITVGVDTDGDGVVDTYQTYDGVQNITFRGGKGENSVAIENVNIAGNLKVLGSQESDLTSVANTLIGGRAIFNGKGGDNAFEDLGGNSFGIPVKIGKGELRGSATPVNMPFLGDDTFSVGDDVVLNANVFQNDLFEGSSLGFGQSGLITSISGSNATASTFDSDGNLILTLTYGTIKVNALGEIEYQPNDVADGLVTTDLFTYTVVDAAGKTATASVKIVIDGNGWDVTRGDVLTAFEHGENQWFDLFDHDADLPGLVTFLGLGDGGDATASMGSIAPGAVMTLRAAQATYGLNEGDEIGSVSVSPHGRLTFTPNADLADALDADDELVIELRYGVNNGPKNSLAYDNIVSVTLTIQGLSTDQAPLVIDDFFGTDKNETVNGSLFTNDSLTVIKINDIDVSHGDVVVLPGRGALLTIGANGDFIYDPNGKFDHVNSQAGATETFTYTVVDGNGGTSTATVTVSITSTDFPGM